MHIKKKYESAGQAAFKHAMDVANKLSTIVHAKTGIEPRVVMAGSRTHSRGGFATSTMKLLFKNVGDFDPLTLNPDTLPEDIIDIGKNTGGEFPVIIDVSISPDSKKESARLKKESTDIANARKIQAGLVEMDAMLAAVGHNVSFSYDAENGIVEISVNNRPIAKKSVAGDSAVTVMNEVWTVVYSYLT